MTYRLLHDALTNKPYGASFTSADGSSTSFVFDIQNVDYAEYLKWVEAGNTPLEADTPPTTTTEG